MYYIQHTLTHTQIVILLHTSPDHMICCKHNCPGYPPIMASMVVSSVTGAGIRDLREKIFVVASELSENRGK